MSGDVMDDVFGIEKPKAPNAVTYTTPPATPTIDDASQAQIATDRLKFRKGRAATRLGASTAPSKPAGFKLLGASA
jgi:hypothetical protein